jgi:hypothetical protein
VRWVQGDPGRYYAYRVFTASAIFIDSLAACYLISTTALEYLHISCGHATHVYKPSIAVTNLGLFRSFLYYLACPEEPQFLGNNVAENGEGA